MGSESTSQSLLRWYIDTRLLTASTSSLPLLDTLQPSDQATVKKYYHLKDKHMSLASYLLKYLFIHRACRIPWDKITISRTPPPHHRPCFIPSSDLPSETPTIDFNVSHQASLIALAGTTTPATSSPNPTTPITTPNPSTTPSPSTPQLGIDITCVNERRTTDTTQQTRPALEEFVDIFAEVFSQRELQTIKNAASTTTPPGRSEADAVAYAFRLFYTYWALKEAYIKMTGEALLAPWLRELEFLDVIAPDPPAAGGGASSLECGVPYTGVRTLLYGRRVADVRIEVVALGEDYLIATAARGGSVGSSSCGVKPDVWLDLKPVDIEEDVGPCARGSCRCLE